MAIKFVVPYYFIFNMTNFSAPKMYSPLKEIFELFKHKFTFFLRDKSVI